MTATRTEVLSLSTRASATPWAAGPAHTARRVPEAFVWWLWESRRAGPELETRDGRSLRVIYPGRRWGSWGPDFRGALLQIDGQLRRGDIEVHVRSTDWAAHGHDGNPEYAGLVLHVLFEAAEGPVRPAGVATVILAAFLAEPIGDLLVEWRAGEAVDIEGACRSPAEGADLLARAGMARLEAKAARFEGDLAAESPLHTLLNGAIESLGYTANAAPMRQLLTRLPVGYLLDVARTEGRLALAALMFGEAGLRARPADEYTQALETAWRASGRSGPSVRLGWRWRGCRPANSPVRRVAAAASLIADLPTQLDHQLVTALLELPPARACTAVRTLMSRSGEAYWRTHADFGRLLAREASVLGPERAADTVVNVVLPWALALGRAIDDPLLQRAAIDAYRAHPLLADNQVTRHMGRQLLGSAAREVVGTACLQQGLIHIYQGWCDGRDCAECPAGPGGPMPLW